jgi:hypothetical protein
VGSNYVEIGWNPWGMLPHLLPQQDDRRSPVDSRVKMTNMKKSPVCARLLRQATRAAKMRDLLQHARPHGGNAADGVKRTRPSDCGADYTR